MAFAKLRGVNGLYEYCCEGPLYEWVFPERHRPPPETAERHVCSAPVWYNDSKALTLVEADYDAFDEPNSTWKLAQFSAGHRDSRLSHRPYKTFQLESDDDLVVVKCKIRPVLLIKKVSSDWSFPGNSSHLFSTWLCLPLFTYKPRHRQSYVIEDQALRRPHHFYFPPGIPGPEDEVVGKIIELQFIPEMNLSPWKQMCRIGTPQMNRPFRLSDKAFQLVLGHIYKILPEVELAGDAKEWYDFFVELVREQIDKIVK